MRFFGSMDKRDERLVKRFTSVFETNEWGDDQSASGTGSRLDSPSVKEAIDMLDRVIREHRIKSVADIPSGDFNWFPYILGVHRDLKYRGFDIVEALVDRNSKRFPHYTFTLFDATNQVPDKVDLIFSKDMVNHLSHADVAKAIANFKRSGSRFLLLSNNFGHSNTELNENSAGASRFLDVTAAPFRMPDPIYRTGYLGLWRLSEVPDGILA